jgi:hypothetical protein
MKIHRNVGVITVSPDITPGKLFTKLNIVSSEARQALLRERRDPFRDEYRVPVYLMSAGRFKRYEDAARKVSCRGEKRPLTLRELLVLNLCDPTIRKMFPIFAGDFVLEYEIHDKGEGDTLVHDRRWMVRHSSFHRGLIIDNDSLFAMTDRTEVDKGNLTFKADYSHTEQVDQVLQRAGLSVETQRLTA